MKHIYGNLDSDGMEPKRKKLRSVLHGRLPIEKIGDSVKRRISISLDLSEEQLNEINLYGILEVLHQLQININNLGFFISGDYNHFKEATNTIMDIEDTLRIKNYDVFNRGLGVFGALNEILNIVKRDVEPKLAQNVESLDDHYSKYIMIYNSILSIVTLANRRIKEFVERELNGNQMIQIPTRRLISSLREVFTAMSINSKGKYHISFDENESENASYLFEVDVKSFLNDSVIIPPVLLDVMRDLIANARKYSPENSNIMLLIEQDDSQIKICVVDNGIGIPDEEKELVVGYGNRGSNVGQKSGLGFGLTKAYYITKSLGGDFDIISKEGLGTEIRLTIPLDIKKPVE